MYKPIVFENLFDSDFNEIVIEELSRNARWLLSHDSIPNGYSDSGFTCCTYHIDQNHPSLYHNQNLNAWAYMIFKKAIKQTDIFHNPHICRFLFNYYNTGSEGSWHQDFEGENMNTLVYYLNDCDGGTYVEDTFFQSKQGSAVLFDSSLTHRGVGPKTFPNRYVLNIIFSDHG